MTQILRPRETAAMIGVTRSTLCRWRSDGKFPPPLQLGPAAVGWTTETIEQWIKDRPAADASEPPGG